jgi:hypothetical protein
VSQSIGEQCRATGAVIRTWKQQHASSTDDENKSIAHRPYHTIAANPGEAARVNLAACPERQIAINAGRLHDLNNAARRYNSFESLAGLGDPQGMIFHVLPAGLARLDANYHEMLELSVESSEVT